MLTTMETLRDTESVRERPRAIITSLDAFMHGRVGDLFLAFLDDTTHRSAIVDFTTLYLLLD